MKKIMFFLAAAALGMTACGGGSKQIRTEADSVSYALGMDMGRYLQNMDKTMKGQLNVDQVFSAIRDVMKDSPKMSQDTAMNFLREYFNVRMPARAKAESEAFMSEVEKNNPGIQKTESGLLYEIIEPGNDVKATQNKDAVRVLYEGTLRDGTVFDSSYERGDTAQFTLGGVIKGWSEGLKLVGEGGKIKLWIPSDLAYGQYGAGGKIGPNEALVFDVQLLEVIPAKEEPAKKK